MDIKELYEKLDKRLSSLEAKLDTANSGIEILKTNQESTLSRLSKLEDRMAKLEIKVSDLNGVVHA